MKIREISTGIILNVTSVAVKNELLASGKYEEVKEEVVKPASSKTSFKKIIKTDEE